MERSALKIHHLSDIHFGSSHFRPDNKSSFIPTVKSRNGDEYLAYLNALAPNASPDLIVLSGDFTTKASQDEMDLANDFICRIKKLTRLNPQSVIPGSAPRILIVPGNHDLDWSKNSSEDRHERYARLSDAVYASGQVVSSAYHTNQEGLSFYDFGDEANLFVYLLNSTHYGGSPDPVLSAMYEAIRMQADKLQLTPESVEDFKRQVRKDPGFILDVDIDKLKAAARSCPSRRFKVAVVHHNPNHVPAFDLEAYDTILNAGRFKSALLEGGYDLVLHGHRHIFHCSVESQPITSFCHNRCLFVSADSFGTKERAPFIEIVLTQAGHAEGEGDGLRRLSLTEYEYNAPGGYAGGRMHCERLMHNQFEEYISTMEGTPPADQATRKRVIENLSAVLLRLHKYQSDLFDRFESSAWIRDLHDQFQSYGQLFATSVRDPYSDSGNANFGRYLREQYDERLRRFPARNEKTIYFSPAAYDAIVRTRWRLSDLFWPDCEIKKSDDFQRIGFEIIRILLLDRTSLDELAIRNLEHDHSIYAIPLFVLDKREVAPEQAVDFVVGMNREGIPLRVWAYDEREGLVKQRSKIEKFEFLELFEKLLQHDRLTTVSRFLGDGMYTGRATISDKVRSYSKNRKASQLLLGVISDNLPEKAEKGVDLCCGTGNYTVPFEKRFSELLGLDQIPEMLAEARSRSAIVSWREADAKATKLRDGYFDAAWMISALHYFKGDEQVLLFEEVHRILRPGGIFIADTEFIEQHPSLWIVEYFPSLRQRYRNSLFSQDHYRALLTTAGFSKVTFQTPDYGPEQGDAFLRIGQHNPSAYLDPAVQTAIPAFQEMDPLERRKGLTRLLDEIKTGEVRYVIERYKKKAKLPGDLGILLASK